MDEVGRGEKGARGWDRIEEDDAVRDRYARQCRLSPRAVPPRRAAPRYGVGCPGELDRGGAPGRCKRSDCISPEVHLATGSGSGKGKGKEKRAKPEPAMDTWKGRGLCPL